MSDFVEFRHLKYIVAIAEAGSFTRAAERLFLAQPSLSRQIKDIEEELGVQIFERTREGVIPTPVGQMVVDYATATLYGRAHIFRIAKEIFFGRIPPLRMGFSSFVSSHHLRTFRTHYNRFFPECKLQLSGGDPVHILQRIDRGDLDCAILPLPIPGPKWVIHHIASSPLVACMRADDPLAEKSTVTLESLVNRLTIFRDPDGHPAAHARLVQLFSEAGHSIDISCSAATPHDIQLLVRDGFGVALVSEDQPLETDITTRRIGGLEWTADTAFVHSSEEQHPALPFICRFLLKKNLLPLKKEATAERTQLPLNFASCIAHEP